jgi:elongation factor Ts
MTSIEKIKKLRDETSLSISLCKKALEASNGDHQAAVEYLRKQGMSAGTKKESRDTKEGSIFVAENDDSIVVVEGSAETDFVSTNERFRAYFNRVAKIGLDSKATSLEQLLGLKYDEHTNVEQARNLEIQAIGENIQVKRFLLIQKNAENSYGIYSHSGGKTVALVELSGGNSNASAAREVAMHCVAFKPEFVRVEEVPAEVKAKEEEIARSQVKDKPPQVTDKIVIGKLQAYYNQVCLVNQAYLKDESVSVQGFLDKISKNVTVAKFWIWKVGQA